MRKELTACFICLLVVWTGSSLLAGELDFSVRAPDEVAVGERFRVVYSLNARPDDFQAPAFEGFRLISGPSQSSSVSTQIINNQVSTTHSISYTFLLEALEEGEFEWPPARARVDGETHQSQALRIRVSGKHQATDSARPARPADPPSPTQPGPDDLFVRATASRTNPYVSELVIISYKLYTRVPVTRFSIERLPSYQGFWTENITVSGQPATTTEVIDGNTYTVAEIRRMAVFPQRAGKLTIEPMEVESLVRMRNQPRGRSLFDDFFRGSPFDSFQDMVHAVRSNALTLEVRPHPVQDRPESFQGLTGQFDFSAALHPVQVEAHEATNLTISIQGQGNIRLSDVPEIRFPPGLEVFDPSLEENIRRGRDGISGERTWDYLLIPRTAGNFEIPEIRFSFFDPAAGAYRSQTAGPFLLEVGGVVAATPGTAIHGGVERAIPLASDIRHIHTRPVVLTPFGQSFFNSFWFYAALMAPVLLFSIFLFIYGRQRKLQENRSLLRYKQARRLARKRLKTAYRNLQNKEGAAFYEEVFHGLWGYASDKMGIPRASLNRENLKEAFREQGIAPTAHDAFLSVLDACEQARFSPSVRQEAAMEGLYARALEAIVGLEKETRQKNKPVT